MSTFLKNLTKQREFIIFLIVLAIAIAMSFASPVFLTGSNISALFMSIAVKAIIAVGMVNLMISGGFDLSVGSVLGFAGAVTAISVKADLPVVLCVLIGVAVGGIAGLINGFFVSKVGINPFVTTLATMSVFEGLTLIVLGGQNIAGLGDAFNSIGQSKFLEIRTPIWYMVIVVVLGYIMLSKMRFFRQNYYIGGNEKAARLSGINVNKMKLFNYIFIGLLTGFAAVVSTSRMGSATTSQGTGYEMDVITAVILGGASLAGGEGSVFGAVLGSILLALINNALNLLSVNVYWQTFCTGMILLTAVFVDQMGKNIKMRTKSEKTNRL